MGTYLAHMNEHKNQDRFETLEFINETVLANLCLSLIMIVKNELADILKYIL